MESNNDVQEEHGWILEIKECLEIQGEEKECCVSVFNVPKELLTKNPEAYIPQCISIGPYHHVRSELCDMERYKLAAARRFQKRINGLGTFESVVVEEFKKHDWLIRSCYHKFIDYNEEILSWFMALDAAFLLECLQFYVRHVDQSYHSDVKQLGRVLDSNGTSFAHHSVVRDLMMLENQLPLFLLQKLLELQLGSKAKAEERLGSLLRLLCQELSPFSFKLPEDSNCRRINERGHLLEVLYYAIVPVFSDQNLNPTLKENSALDTADMPTVTQAFSFLGKTLSSVNVGPVRFLTGLPRRTLNQRPVQFVMKLPLRLLFTLGNLPVLRTIKKPLAVLIQIGKKETEGKGEGEAEGVGEESSFKIIQPDRDELDIPSVADLYSVGVKFSPTNGDLTTIQFDGKTATLHLPKVTFDINTEVILKNLVAFEASAGPGPLVFRRYTDFMNGMIDSEEDVRLLRESGIISNHLRRDGEVASLWNSMGKCAVLITKVGYLDKVIKDVNQYYHRSWKVRVMEFVNNHVYVSWKLLSFVAAVILLVMTCFQAFCSVYDCKQMFGKYDLLEDRN